MASRSGEKTSFAIACGLLSQLMKDNKGNSLNLNLGMGESYQRPTTTMELFPQTAGFDAPNPSEEEPPKQQTENSSQLTIFYGGRVVVFDNYPADKAQELMSFASKGSSICVAPPTSSSSSSSQISATDDQSAVPLPNAQVQAAPKPAQAKISDLPIMRKASLQRFLEKRKDRLNAKAPYQLQVCASKKEIAAPKKENVEELWFGLGPKV